jgi:exodeoxyribonuclease-3
MILATFNVNSVRARLPVLLDWIGRRRPDVISLQETKVVDEEFPRAELKDAGYYVETFGQKTYNGVAIASLSPMKDVCRGLPGEGPDDQKRVIEATIDGIRVVNLYVPNGKDPEAEEFGAKLEWLDRLRLHLEDTLTPEEPVVVLGDMNITPDDRDVYDPERLRETIHCTTKERRALAKLKGFGLADALRLVTDDPGRYTWWDYRGGNYPRGLGLRIDLILVTRPVADRLKDVVIDEEPRRAEKPSDHTPVLLVLE